MKSSSGEPRRKYTCGRATSPIAFWQPPVEDLPVFWSTWTWDVNILHRTCKQQRERRARSRGTLRSHRHACLTTTGSLGFLASARTASREARCRLVSKFSRCGIWETFGQENVLSTGLPSICPLCRDQHCRQVATPTVNAPWRQPLAWLPCSPSPRSAVDV